MNSPFVPVNYSRFRRYMTHAVLEELHGNMRWSEGPVWFGDAQMLLFSDIPSNKILRWVEGQGVSVYRETANKANGLTRDRQGRLLVCESGGRRVTRTELCGSVTVLADQFNGGRLNSPNDIVVKSDGSIWFTDPDYGLLTNYTGVKGEPEIGSCNVYRIDPDGSIQAVITDLQKPNGLAFSPDEKILYVADSGATHITENGAHAIFAFDVEQNRLKNRREFAVIEHGVPDGFRVDVDGNIWVATVHAGISVFANDGELIGKIEITGAVANLAFGGEYLNRIFITAGQKLYGLYTGAQGQSPV